MKLGVFKVDVSYFSQMIIITKMSYETIERVIIPHPSAADAVAAHPCRSYAFFIVSLQIRQIRRCSDSGFFWLVSMTPDT